MNFTAAARKLNITQPAVSQHIRFLEEQYHTSLFRYQNKQLFLTRSGEILHKHLLTMKNDEKAVIAELESSSTGIEFLLFICCNRFSCPEGKCPEKGFCFSPFRSDQQSSKFYFTQSLLHSPRSASGIYHIQAVNCSMTVYNCLPCPISDRYKNCNSSYVVYQYLPSFLQPQLL